MRENDGVLQQQTGEQTAGVPTGREVRDPHRLGHRERDRLQLQDGRHLAESAPLHHAAHAQRRFLLQHAHRPLQRLLGLPQH